MESNQLSQQRKRPSRAAFPSAQAHPLPHSLFESISNAARLLARSHHRCATHTPPVGPARCLCNGSGAVKAVLLGGNSHISFSPVLLPSSSYEAFPSGTIAGHCSITPPSLPLQRASGQAYPTQLEKRLRKSQMGFSTSLLLQGFKPDPAANLVHG